MRYIILLLLASCVRNDCNIPSGMNLDQMACVSNELAYPCVLTIEQMKHFMTYRCNIE